MSDTTPPSQDFAATVSRLETLVERLESGELSLEEALTAFEEGVQLTRDAQKRLDSAELKVRALSEDGDGKLTMTPFESPADAAASASPDDDAEDTPPW
ncbi:exodeoxyribonuclease VII small subunit [Halomonas sp. GD1P12]|uniref:exodeoxyribonuclease VII small subunit n=1 Tax=Halomonas sp. GD1P12 TaxID=2982691 RepID=UPI0021E495B3|nr:exodeoxyribonuclease VII small subunit [Halomonas sp. GD1P12]UYF99714.1 exodeoxyribonuclease VII small subunit [Halomonas sp. GD1P12]